MSECEETDLGPPMFPPGQQVIRNAAYPTLVADLTNGDPNGLVIGNEYKKTSNQVWTLISLGGKKIKIETTAKTGDQALAYNSDPSPGDPVYCSASASVYNYAPADAGNYKIFISAPPAKNLYWTLNTGAAGTTITLEEDTGSASQIWKLRPPS